MKETLKRIKADVILSAILCVALGVILMIWPTQVTKVLCYILAAILCVMGIGHIISYMRNKLESRLGLATGIALVILGVWILVQPLNFAKIFPVVIGVVLLMHGLEDLRMTIEAKQNGDTAWGILLLITILNFAFGILLIWKAIEMVQIAMVIVGIALIYDGLSDLFVVYRVAGAVKAAKQAAEAKGVSDNMQFIHCAAQDVASHLETPVDLILFHAVLEWVADPRSVLQTLWSVLRPGGVLSLMFYNAHGLLMHNMVAGNFDYVQAGMPKKKKRTLSPDYPRDPAQVYLWLEEAGWQIMGKTGVRVFHDYLREKHQQRDCYEALLELETRYCRQEPYITLGRYIHVTARKPQSKDKV